jgi:hypothetical protein
MEDSQVRQHPAFTTFQQLQDARDWPEIGELTATPEAAGQWQKYLHFVAAIDDLFTTTPSRQISTPGLDSLNNIFRRAFHT